MTPEESGPGLTTEEADEVWVDLARIFGVKARYHVGRHAWDVDVAMAVGRPSTRTFGDFESLELFILEHELDVQFLFEGTGGGRG